MLSTDGSGRRRVLVRDASDVSRLILYLFTRWRLPRLEIHGDALPAVVVQRAQHHFARISAACNCVLGVMLGMATLLLGWYLKWATFESLIWTSSEFRQQMVVLVSVALGAGLTGWAIEAIWTRVRLTLLLRGLRRQLVSGKTRTEPARYVGRVSRHPVAKHSAVIEDDGVAHDNHTTPRSLRAPKRPSVHLRSTADLDRLVRHLFTHWRMPRVEINVDGVATLDVQRAQQRIARLSATCNCVLGALLAAATVLAGSLYVEWMAGLHWDWWVPDDWGSMGMVAVAASCAALIGWAIEMVWTRVRLMRVLGGVRHRLAA